MKVHPNFPRWVSIFMKNSLIGSEKIIAGAQPGHLFIYYLFIYFFYLFIYLFILFIYLFILFIYLFYLFIYLFYLFIIYLFIYFIYLFIYFIYLFILFIYLLPDTMIHNVLSSFHFLWKQICKYLT